MENPFLKRATEMLRDQEAFLAMVTPEPVKYFLSGPGKEGVLYDRLVFVRGTPGSGKTTLATLFEFPTLAALLRNRNIPAHRTLVSALVDSGAIASGTPAVLGCRLPMETDYRDFWEFPYQDELKLSLMTALVQARAVLGWIRNLTSAGVMLEEIEIVPRHDAEAATLAVGGTDGMGLLERARSVELALYKVVGALVAPDVSSLDVESTGAYRPFDVIDLFRVPLGRGNERRNVELRPLVILDDAHVLHPAQYQGVKTWLMRRELRVARWVLTRLDVMHPEEALAAITEDRAERVQLPGVTVTRETTEIMLQSGLDERRPNRTSFRRMAKDMANRYLGRMAIFNSRGLNNLSDLMSTDVEPLPATKRRELAASVEATRKRLSISESRFRKIEEEVDKYKPARGSLPDDVRLGMIIILMNRYAKRIPQQSLFSQEIDPEPTKALTADSTVYEAARIQLLHRYDRPYYIGIDDLCDAGSENAEQFLRLAAVIVETAMTRLVRSQQPSVDAATQNRQLRRRGEEVIAGWNFPQYQLVRQLAGSLAERCRDESLLPNAWLGAGPNAYGIVQEEFDEIPEKYPDLARVLQFGFAYNAFNIVPRYQCKDRKWCLLELGGVVILKYGLSLKRGNFLEGTADELNGLIKASTQ
jgi:hypothetical protein